MTCHYINGKKLYTEEFVKELEQKLTIAINALKDIYHADLGDEDLSMEEEIAKEALTKIKGNV